MGSHREPQPLLIGPGFSRQLAWLVGLTHLVAAAVVLVLQLGLTSFLLLLLVLASALYIGYVDVLRRAPWSIRSAIWNSDGTWQIHFVSGAEREVQLTPATFITLPLVVLNFRLGRLRRRAMPVFADALHPDQLRRLRQRLRVEGATLMNPSRKQGSA
jgi:toxin CptA